MNFRPPTTQDGPSALQDTVQSSGFPSLDPGARGAAGGGASLLGGGDDEDGSRIGRRRGGSSARTPSRPAFSAEGGYLARPNGVRVIGFARTVAIVQKFVETLEAQERTQANGETLLAKKVHFSEASVRRLDQNVLWNAPTQSGINAAAYETGGVLNDENSIYSFELNIEFESPFYLAKPKESVANKKAKQQAQDSSSDDSKDERRNRR